MLYRVSVRTTASLQPGPGHTYWSHDVIYCGDDLAEARRVYHTHEPADYYHGHGNSARETLFEKLDTNTLENDDPGVMAHVSM